MFFRKKIERKTYDPEIRKPAIRVSICTGEKVAGFKNLKSERFEEIMLLNDEKDLKEFKETYGIKEEIEKFY
ncbi:MAG: hypothetical protein J6S49_00825 [Erysipelotrichaceae bacterium]|nr:hypothetical protein [Erysipelotrichaceae bacterium]